MKKMVILALAFLLIAANVFAADGDLIVNGNVGIGTTSPGVKLTTQGINGAPSTSGTAQIYGGFRIENQANNYVLDFGINGETPWIQSTDKSNLATNSSLLLNPTGGNVGIGTLSPGERLEVVGNVKATGFLYSSDRSLKKDISKIENALDKIIKLNGVSFRWKENNKRDLGLIAQDIEKVFPELVATNAKGLKSVEYGNLTAVLIEAIKEQQLEIKELKKEIRKLKK